MSKPFGTLQIDPSTLIESSRVGMGQHIELVGDRFNHTVYMTLDGEVTLSNTVQLPGNPQPLRPGCGGHYIARRNGLFWAGFFWVKEIERALFFTGTPDPYADAELLVRSLRHRGHRCNVAYLCSRDVCSAS